jgi:predicted nuclease of predicted toxin-antitoxin system
VKLLFDQNLPPGLVEALSDLYPGSAHVQKMGLDRATDDQLWAFARDQGYAIVTKDADFSDRSAWHGFPPKVVWLRLGNSSTAEIESALRKHQSEMLELDQDSRLGVLAVFKSRIEN